MKNPSKSHYPVRLTKPEEDTATRQMGKPRSSSFALSAVVAVLGGFVLIGSLGSFPSLQAADVTWDGDTDPNNNGTWEIPANWDTDAIPDVGDNAKLDDVASGTREVTLSDGSAQAINRLTVTQTTPGAVNVLNVNDDLTLSGTGIGYAPFVIAPTAGPGSIITNIADGKTLKATGDAKYTSNFDGTLNLGAGSVFRLESTSSSGFYANFGGPINATGVGAKMTFYSPGYVANGPQYNGAITVSGVGSSFTIEKLADDVGHTAMFLDFKGDDGAGNSIKLGTGTQMDIVDLDYSAITFSNRVTLEDDAILYMGSATSTSKSGSRNNIDFNGGVAMGAGAQTTVSLGNVRQVNLKDDSLWETGSKLLLQYRNSSGDAQFIQSGGLTMDGAALEFDYVADSEDLSVIPRNYQNTGTWTLKNGSTVAFVSSNGRSTSGVGGSTLGSYNNNSGTFNLESGSEIGFRSYYNTGTMNLGSSTAGVSDALVTLGSPDNTFTHVLLLNGAPAPKPVVGPDQAGTINVNGNTLLGRTVDADSTLTFENGSGSSTGSVLNVGDGAVAATLTVANRDVVISNFTGNTINLNPNGTLLLKSIADNTGSPTTGNVTLTNNGTLVHAGSLAFQGSFNGTREITTFATGSYQVSGSNAVLEALPSATGSSPENVSAISFSVYGKLSGASASDKLTYVNSTGNAAHDFLDIGLTVGSITPGLGTNGSGTSSIGSLELVDTNVTLSSVYQETLAFDLGGVGVYDSLILSGGIMDLGTNGILDIWTVNGFTPSYGTFQLISADSLTGTFGTLKYNGTATSGEYAVTYLADGAQIQFIPEPSIAMLLLGGLGILLLDIRRRRRNDGG